MSTPAPVSAAVGGVRIDVRVTPRASRTRIDGVRDGRIVVRVTAPPVDSAANDAVLAAIADQLGVAKRAVRLVSGGRGRQKVVEVDGVDVPTATERLCRPLRA